MLTIAMFPTWAAAQKRMPGTGNKLSLSRAEPETRNADTGSRRDYILLPLRNSCKGMEAVYYRLGEVQRADAGRRSKKSGGEDHSLVKVHGNVTYDLNYWSRIDTPFAEQNVYQHTVQTYLDVTYKDNYPFRVFFTTRWSNSSLFKSFTDLNFLYNATDFNNRVKRQVKDLLQQRMLMDSLPSVERQLLGKRKSYDSLQNWLSEPSQLQRLVAEQERLFLLRRRQEILKQMGVGKDSGQKVDWSSLPDLSSIGKNKFSKPSGKGGDSSKTYQLDSSFAQRYDSARRTLDSLSADLAAFEKKYSLLKASHDKNMDSALKDVDHITTGDDLKEKMRQWNISDSSLPKGYSTLYSVRSFGIGRTLLNYSELSAKNVSINGMQVEYNPSYYAAFAIGTVDYRFRDYTVQNAVKGQYIGLARYGWGKKDGNSLIFTYYNGRRQLYNAYTTPQGTDIPNYNLMGFTLEARYKVGRTTTLIAEAAKSSSPYYSLDSLHGHNTLGTALKFGDHTNEAWSVKVNSFIPKTRTQVDASFSQYGANFQSFSLFTTGAKQTAWSFKVSQPFFNRRLQVVAGIRTNDFTNPLLSSAYKTTALFETFQATLRAKHLPVISVGYFPSSQVIKLGDGQFQENLFYTLTANLSQTYKVDKISLLSMLMYTQFYNKLRDTGFVYYNTKNLLFSQSAFLGRLTVQVNLSAAMSDAYNLYVADGKADFRLLSWLTVGAGVKYNDQTGYDIQQWGYSGNAGIIVPKIGEFRLTADKAFIPGNNKQLVENKTGRLTYSKVF
ncbi:MAG: hypothetical protein JST68_20525 [Bacteroidetes bacterium]|nr:hypothetical protein [Bacteroidota bacterium]